MWIQTEVTVWKWLNGVMTSVALTSDLWPWPFSWISCLSMVKTPENFRMIRWQEHGQKGITDGRTDRQTEISVLRAAWSQCKKTENFSFVCFIWNLSKNLPQYLYRRQGITDGIVPTDCSKTSDKLGQKLGHNQISSENANDTFAC